jgi:hypothetical protein
MINIQSAISSTPLGTRLVFGDLKSLARWAMHAESDDDDADDTDEYAPAIWNRDQLETSGKDVPDRLDSVGPTDIPI